MNDIVHTMSMNNQVFILGYIFLCWCLGEKLEGRKREQDAARDDDGDLCDRRIDSLDFHAHSHAVNGRKVGSS